MKKYKILIEETMTGVLEVEAESVESAREKFWEEVEKTDMGTVMNESEGFKIADVHEVKED